MDTLGKRIRNLRWAREWTQQELAARAGTNHRYISALERDSVSSPGFDLLQRLARAFEISLNELLRDTALGLSVAQLVTVALGQEGMVPAADLEAERDSRQALLASLGQIWPRLTDADREAVEAMIRALVARYEPALLQPNVLRVRRHGKPAPREDETAPEQEESPPVE